jgi:hypothetical protein
MISFSMVFVNSASVPSFKFVETLRANISTSLGRGGLRGAISRWTDLVRGPEECGGFSSRSTR